METNTAPTDAQAKFNQALADSAASMAAANAALADIAAGLNRLGFRVSVDHVTSSALNRTYGKPHQAVDGVAFRVRSPRGSEGVPTRLIFEVNPLTRHREFVNEGEIRVHTHEAGWVEKVQAWMAAEVPKAKARKEASDAHAVRSYELQQDVYAVQNEIRETLNRSGYASPSFKVWNDGKKITQAEVTLYVPGANAQELAARIAVLLREISAMGNNPPPANRHAPPELG